jgi:hypothetical protein
LAIESQLTKRKTKPNKTKKKKKEKQLHAHYVAHIEALDKPRRLDPIAASSKTKINHIVILLFFL